ncbi:hypothetical protein Tco_1201293 [Tanacetum coccineum]
MTAAGSGSDEMGDEDDDDGGVGLMMVAWCCCWWCVAWDDDGRQWMLAGYGGVDDNDNVGGVDVVGESGGCCGDVRRLLAGIRPGSWPEKWWRRRNKWEEGGCMCV